MLAEPATRPGVTRASRGMRPLVAAALVAAVAGGCAARTSYIPGTKVPDTDENRDIVMVIERYRKAIERKDTPALVAMAAKSYWEDGGTPSGSDDYGYEGLREVLLSRFQRANDIRYSVRYMNLKRQDNRAFVEILIDASYSIDTGRGPMRLDMRDQNQVVLENVGGKWMFVSGM